jgi:hypothetical protein
MSFTLLVLLVCAITAAQGQVYTEIPHNATHPGGTLNSCVPGNNPLGYYCGTIPNFETINPTIITYTLTGLANKQVEINVEAFDFSSSVCFVMGNEAPICGSGTAYYCGDPPAASFTVRFECNNNDCDNADVTAWYRITTSPDSTTTNIENWCQNERDSSNRPSSLLQTPTDNSNASQETPTGSGYSVLPLAALTLASVLLSYLLN